MKVYKRSSYLVSLFFALLICIGTSHAVKSSGTVRTSNNKSFQWSADSDEPSVIVTDIFSGKEGHILGVSFKGNGALNTLTWEVDGITYDINTTSSQLTINESGKPVKEEFFKS